MTNTEGLLRSLADRIDKLDDEISDLNGDKKELYAEAKGAGFDVKAFKAAVSRRRKLRDKPEATAEADTLLELYLGAILDAPEAFRPPAGSAGPANGTLEEPSRVRVQAHEEIDPETGEIMDPASGPLPNVAPTAGGTGEAVSPEAASPQFTDDDLEIPECLRRTA